MAKEFMKSNYPTCQIIYGDTDSIFVIHDLKTTKLQHEIEEENRTGIPFVIPTYSGKTARERAKAIATEACERFQPCLRWPGQLEMEALYTPFILMSAKRYTCLKYEDDMEKFKMVFNGVQLKRRDSTGVLKYTLEKVYGALLFDRSLEKAQQILQSCLEKIESGALPLELYTLSKSLRSHYKNKEVIPHKVLADRLEERGDMKFLPNDRIPYVFIIPKGKVRLQGERIEHPDFLQREKAVIDYGYYIERQLVNPLCQLFALAVDKFSRGKFKLPERKNDETLTKYEVRCRKEKEKLIKRILFGDVLNRIENRRTNQQQITRFFKKY
jgi:DNA polymerase elongation subunit (family B)